jgi:hypothetical protein
MGLKTQNTLEELLTRLAVDIQNMNSFLYSLNTMLESKSDNVDITQTYDDGSQYSITVPSFGYLKGKIDDLNENFNTLINTNDDVIGIKSENGDVRKFELQKVSSLISDLEDVETTSFEVPNDFRIKNNWFFESFLNPLLFVSVDLTSILTDDMDQFAVKRIIINSIEDDDLEYFDDNYKGNNNLILDNITSELEDKGIDYIEDDNIVALPVGINRYRGNFDVLRIFEEEIIETVNDTNLSVVRRRYKLSTLFYNDVLDSSEGSKILAEGNRLITQDDSEYEVVSVNVTNSEVVLERIFGIDPITIGADILKIKPVIYRVPELQVNVGFNEREIIFVKPISKKNNLTTDGYSNGFAVYTNELVMQLDDDSQSSLEDYYNNFVADFGMILLSMAKEQQKPAIVAQTPDSPVLDAANFQVVQVDAHIKEAENVIGLQSKVKEKEDVSSQQKEIDRKITDLKAEITTKVKTQAEKQRIEKSIKEKTEKRKILQDRVSTLVKDITLTVASTPQFVTPSKYKVRGFWEIPSAKSSPYGDQQVVQFIYRYRYLSKKGTAPNATQSEFIEKDGTKKFAVFSPWQEIKTKPRVKALDEDTGLYVWTTENVSDADEVNTNQLAISIRKGEIVEVQVKSLSEAGWPSNPAESAWSESVQVEFPRDVESAEEGTIISQKVFAEESRIQFEEELNAKGLDLHLDSQFTTGDRFFAHVASNISSGFFTTEGNVVDLYEKLKSIESSIQSLQQSIELAKGVIKVTMIDPDGNTLEVNNGQTLEVFGGFYRDLIKDTTSGTVVYNHGRIVTRQYIMNIENTSQTALELFSTLYGGIDILAPTSNPSAFPTEDYHVNRRYDIVPLGITEIASSQIGEFKEPPSLQSGQVKSQYTYSRYKNFGFGQNLYEFDPINGTSGSNYGLVAAYSYNGQVIGADTVPYNWGHFLPFDPTISAAAVSTTTDADVWVGTTNLTGDPIGNGNLSQFCIHKDHPSLLTLGNSFNISAGTNLEDTFRPVFDGGVTILTTATQEQLPFAQGLHFETSENELTNIFNVNYLEQAARVTATNPGGVAQTARTDENYPIKLGFTPEDEYLVGKYTCGAYLYPFPLNYSVISVEGNNPLTSAKVVQYGSENSINIPILFQFRCSDKLENVGGYRLNESLTNIKYTKKIGIDLYIKNDVPFSFDLQLSCRYKKVTSLDAPIVPSSGLTSVTF